jgi:hypothetical protein
MMKRLYLALTILGAIAPSLFFFQFFSSEGIRVGSFLSALFANGAAGGFTADPLITSLVFWIAMFQRRGKREGPNPLPFIALNLLMGFPVRSPPICMRARLLWDPE